MRALVMISCVCLLFRAGAQQFPHENAHAHNDYEHQRPLLDALDNGFISVEADVFCVDGELYVYHNLPATIDKTRTLENLYLKPLSDIIREKGSIYKNYTGPFYLMIDFKTSFDKTYPQLIKLLSSYDTIITIVRDGQEHGNHVKVFISGNRSSQQIIDASTQLAALDGRPEDLGKSISPAVMPVVSENFRKFSSWKGTGPMPQKELDALQTFTERVHAEGKKVRLWGAPDNPETWKMLLTIGVDLINTDRLKELNAFLADFSLN